MKQIEAESQSLVDEFLLASAKERGAAGICSTDVAGGRHAAGVESRIGGRSQVKEDLLT